MCVCVYIYIYYLYIYIYIYVYIFTNSRSPFLQVFYETGALSACDVAVSVCSGPTGAVLPEEVLLRHELSETSGDVAHWDG